MTTPRRRVTGSLAYPGNRAMYAAVLAAILALAVDNTLPGPFVFLTSLALGYGLLTLIHNTRKRANSPEEPTMTDHLDPQDVALLRALAGANFLGGQVTLPSGRVLTSQEVQALASAYAPAAGEAEVPDEMARHVNDTARHIAGLSPELGDDMVGHMPRDDESLEAHWRTNGGDQGNERTQAILREADRPRSRRRRFPR